MLNFSKMEGTMRCGDTCNMLRTTTQRQQPTWLPHHCRKSHATFFRSHRQKRTERERGVVETSGRNGKKKPLCLPQPRFFAVGWMDREAGWRKCSEATAWFGRRTDCFHKTKPRENERKRAVKQLKNSRVNLMNVCLKAETTTRTC